jgi:hypothetical protein
MAEYAGFVDFDGFIFMCVLFAPGELAAKHLSRLWLVIRKVLPLKVTHKDSAEPGKWFQSDLASSIDVLRRFRRLWVAAMLDKPLTHCTDRQVGELMNCIKDRLDIFDPEMAVCHHAKRRLLRSACVGVQSKSTDREAGGE